MSQCRISKSGVFVGVFLICLLQFVCSFFYMFFLDKTSTVVICNGYSQILEDDIPETSEHEDNGKGNFQLHINRKSALLHGHFKSNKSYLTIGIPSVARRGVNYLDSTIDSLLRHSTTSEQAEIVVAIYLADSNQTWISQTGERIKRKYFSHLESGFLQVFHYKEQIFPNFSKVPRTFNDSLERVFWRCKQNIDYAFMFMYCKNISYYYMQLEDDVQAMPNYFANMKFFVSNVNAQKSWFCLEFSSLGFLGKLVRSSDLQQISNFLLMFYWHQPGDLLLKYLIHINTQFEDIRQKPSLFQHKGVVSSLSGKRQYLTDSSVMQTFSRKRFYNLNPKAIVSTTMEAFEEHTAEKAYDLSDDYFWGISPRKGDKFLIKFHQLQNITRLYIGQGIPQRTGDVFEDCAVNVATENCEKWENIGRIKNSEFDTNILKIILPINIRCISLNVLSNQTTWVVVREISVFKKGDVAIENPSFYGSNKMKFSRQEIQNRLKQNKMYSNQMSQVRMEEFQRQQLAKMNADAWLKKVRQLPNIIQHKAPLFKPNFVYGQQNKNLQRLQKLKITKQ